MKFTTGQQANSNCLIEGRKSAGAGSPPLLRLVGRVLRRRIGFLALFIFWSIKHRSTKHAAWLAAYEGYPWK